MFAISISEREGKLEEVFIDLDIDDEYDGPVSVYEVLPNRMAADVTPDGAIIGIRIRNMVPVESVIQLVHDDQKADFVNFLRKYAPNDLINFPIGISFNMELLTFSPLSDMIPTGAYKS
jgi:hypothetical protein